MICDFEDQTDLTPIVVDDDDNIGNVDVIDEPMPAPDIIIKDKAIQYDVTKVGSTCLSQFFINYKTETKLASCLLCSSTVKKSGDSTFNFVRHVKRHHLGAYNEWKKNLAMKEEKSQLKQSSIKNAMMSPRGTKYTRDHPRQLALSKMVTNDLIIGLVLPLSIVERPEFVHAVFTVDPKFVVPSRRSLCRDVLPKMVEKVESELNRICRSSRFVSLTLDLWTDRRMRCFYAITIHFISECLFKSHLLTFKCFSGSHTGDNLMKEYEAITARYDIEDKVVRLVTDNASNNIKAFGSLIVPGFEPYFEESPDEYEGDDEEDEEVVLGGEEANSDEACSCCNTSFGGDELLRMPCFTHSLQLVVSDSFKESSCIKLVMAKVSSIAKFSHKSTIMAEKLQHDGICIPIAVITRWNSQYYTVAKIVEIPSDKLNDYLKESKKESLILSQRDIAVLNEFVSIFALIAEVFTKAQADQSASISLVAPSLLEIYFDLDSEQATLKYAGGICKALLKSMQDRFGGLLKQFGLSIDVTPKIRSTSELYSDSFFLIAPFLDARFGFRWIMHSKLSDDIKVRLCETIKRLVINAALQLHGAHRSANLEATIETPNITSNNNTNSNLKRKTLFVFPMDQEPSAKKTRSSVLEELEEEVLLFSKEASDDSALVFRKAKIYPYLNVLALRVLCVPATSAPVERVFSTSGFVIRPHRGRLTKEMLAKLTFLKCNSDLIH